MPYTSFAAEAVGWDDVQHVEAASALSTPMRELSEQHAVVVHGQVAFH